MYYRISDLYKYQERRSFFKKQSSLLICCWQYEKKKLYKVSRLYKQFIILIFSQQNPMILLLLIASSLIFQSRSYFAVNSNAFTTTVQFPIGSKTMASNNYQNAQPNVIEGSTWIWTTTPTNRATFETLFYGRYAASAYIYIKANSTYNVTLNGQFLRIGTKFNLDGFSITLACGLNNLTIQVQNSDPNATSSGLVFSVIQSDNLVSCSTNLGFYNFSTCNCQCLGDFNCMTGQLKLGYPTCGCACVNQGTRCSDLRQYYDLKTCSCKCFPVFCQPGFKQDPDICTCRCFPTTPCANGTIWNYNQCRCL